MQSQALFSFGPNDLIYHRAAAGKRGSWLPWVPGLLPEETKRLIRNDAPTEDFCAMGEDDVVYLWKRRDGTWSFFSRAPPKLAQWLTKQSGGQKVVQRDVATLHIAIGPNNSFYAHDKDSFVFSKLPSSLESLVATGARPKCVTLGVKGAWACIDSHGRLQRMLAGYDRLDKTLDRRGALPVAFISLSSTTPGDYFCAFADQGQAEPFDFKVSVSRVSAVLSYVGDRPHFSLDGRPADPETTNAERASNLKVEVARLQGQVRSLEAENARLASEVASLQEANGELEGKVRQEEDNKVYWRDLYSRTLNERNEFSQELNELRNDHNQLLRRARSSSSLQVPNAAAQSLFLANQQANRDFMIRQQLSAAQFNQQQRLTTLSNIQTMQAATNIQMGNMTIW